MKTFQLIAAFTAVHVWPCIRPSLFCYCFLLPATVVFVCQGCRHF